jgi:hypothetical protein
VQHDEDVAEEVEQVHQVLVGRSDRFEFNVAVDLLHPHVQNQNCG